jgi:hypothetical protein
VPVPLQSEILPVRAHVVFHTIVLDLIVVGVEEVYSYFALGVGYLKICEDAASWGDINDELLQNELSVFGVVENILTIEI